MQDMQVWSLDWEEPLEKEMATHFSILAGKIPWTEEPGGCSPWGHKESDTTEQLSTYAHLTRIHFSFKELSVCVYITRSLIVD